MNTITSHQTFVDTKFTVSDWPSKERTESNPFPEQADGNGDEEDDFDEEDFDDDFDDDFEEEDDDGYDGVLDLDDDKGSRQNADDLDFDDDSKD